MGSLSKKVPYLSDNFLLIACRFMASSQGNVKFTEFIHLHGADSISQKLPKFYLLTHYFTYSPKFFCQFVVLPIRQSFPPPVFQYTVLILILSFTLITKISYLCHDITLLYKFFNSEQTQLINNALTQYVTGPAKIIHIWSHKRAQFLLYHNT